MKATVLKVKGKHTTAKIFTDFVEETALEQVRQMVNHEFTKSTKVRIMPDIHAGKGSTIGTTIKLPDEFSNWKVSPNIVGVDVGCGILMYKLGDNNVDLALLDVMVNKMIPAGFNVHDNPKDLIFSENAVDNLTFNAKNKDRIHNSLGTLGGGNHFIELGKDGNGDYWLSVHSGSRGLGVQVAAHHQNIAIKLLREDQVDLKEVIEDLKNQGRQNEIQEMINKVKKNTPAITKDMESLAYLKGEYLKCYLSDMIIAQSYARKSRQIMLDIIVEAMGFSVVDEFDSPHNFISFDDGDTLVNGVVRKGATPARLGERIVIPLNMRDGLIVAIGKGNEEWNNSAPHGAGRLMSRSQARKTLDLKRFKEQMEGVYSSSVGESTIDEAPDSYKPAELIIEQIKPTADIVDIVKPVYNFKAH